MSLALDILNIRCFWHSKGKCEISNSVPGPGDFQSELSENMLLRMEVADIQLSKKTEIKGVDMGYLSMFTCLVEKYTNICRFHCERQIKQWKLK